jgi:two-component sensor histidine kinase
MAGRRIKDPHSKEVFGDILSKVQSLALIHTKLYASEHFTKVNIASFTIDIYNQIAMFETWRSVKPKPVFKLDETVLPVNLALPVCLFINEALTNIFRHAFPKGLGGEIGIEISRANNLVRIVVSDNGIGIPEEVDLSKPTGMGLKLMSGIAEYQLHGGMAVDRSEGTTITLEFPVDPNVD